MQVLIHFIFFFLNNDNCIDLKDKILLALYHNHISISNFLHCFILFYLHDFYLSPFLCTKCMFDFAFIYLCALLMKYNIHKIKYFFIRYQSIFFLPPIDAFLSFLIFFNLLTYQLGWSLYNISRWWCNYKHLHHSNKLSSILVFQSLIKIRAMIIILSAKNKIRFIDSMIKRLTNLNNIYLN